VCFVCLSLHHSLGCLVYFTVFFLCVLLDLDFGGDLYGASTTWLAFHPNSLSIPPFVFWSAITKTTTSLEISQKLKCKSTTLFIPHISPPFVTLMSVVVPHPPFLRGSLNGNCSQPFDPHPHSHCLLSPHSLLSFCLLRADFCDFSKKNRKKKASSRLTHPNRSSGLCRSCYDAGLHSA
jgi:hypothetical protein